MKLDRRLFLLGGAIAVLAANKYSLFSPLFQKPLQFEPTGTPAGFRRLPGGLSSSGFNPFLGVSSRLDPDVERAIADVNKNICKNLFGSKPVDDRVVQIASFSDYYCPYCRVLTQKLSRIEEKSNGKVVISWHELPLLGEASNLAAKAALAAKRQGAYIQFHKRLMRSAFRATPGYLDELATEIGVDPDQFFRDMAGEEIVQELLISAALAKIFVFIGTPAIVIGRTVIQGEIGDRMLGQIIDQERLDGPLKGCETA